MANNVGDLFGKYSATYSKAGGEGEDLVPLDPKEQKKASRNELHGFDGGALRVSKRGGNFLNRVVCWLEDRVLSLTRSVGREPTIRQKHSSEFARHVSATLTEIGEHGADGVENHYLMKKIELVQKRDLPLRSGFVRSILWQVALLQGDSGQGVLPDIAKQAFLAEPPAVPGVDYGGRDEGEHQIPDDRNVAHRGDQNQPPPDIPANKNVAGGGQQLPPQMAAGVHKADVRDYKDFANLSSGDFTEKLCQYMANFVSKIVDGQLDQRECRITNHQCDQIVRETTLRLADNKYPGGEGEDRILTTFVTAQDMHKQLVAENEQKGFPRSPADLEKTVVTLIGYNIGVNQGDWMETIVSENLNNLMIEPPLENADQGIP